MKNLFSAFLLMFVFHSANGQIEIDSIRTVNLQEVSVVSKQAAPANHLYKFFTGNKSATTEDILSRLPEISLNRRGSFGMEPGIRSYGASQINLLLDGMKIHGACTDKMDPASIYIEPQNLKSIDVATNGASLLNGSSLGGSINMKLAEAHCHEQPLFSAVSSSAFHSISNSFSQSLNINYGHKKWAARLSGTYRNANNYKDGNGKEISFTQFEKANFSANIKYHFDAFSYIKSDFIFDEGWNIGYAALPMDVGYAKARIGALSYIKENKRDAAEFLQVKIYANEVRHFMDDTHRPDAPMHMDMPGISKTFGGFAESVFGINPNQQLHVKTDASITRLHASMTMYENEKPTMFMLTWPDNEQKQWGFTADYMFKPDSLTKINVIGRIDLNKFNLTTESGKNQFEILGFSKFDKLFIIPSASIIINRILSSRIKTGISLSYNGRSPSAGEFYGYYLFNRYDGYDYLGNPDLAGETAGQAEWNIGFMSKKIKLSASAYLSKIDHYILGEIKPHISSMTNGANGVKQYINAGTAWMHGAEAGVIYMPFSNTTFVSTCKYTSGSIQDDPLPLIPPFKNISSIKQVIKKFWLQMEGETAAAQKNVSAKAGESKTPSYFLMHARAGYNFKLFDKKAAVNSGIENLFNAQYHEHLDWGGIPRPGRNFYLQLNISF